MRGLLANVVVSAILASTASAQRRLVNVYADVSLRESFESIERRFEAANPNSDLRFTFSGSGSLANQIKDGASADVFVSAGPRPVVALGATLGRSRTFARNALVLVTPEGKTDIERLPDLVKAELVLLPALEDPGHAYARQLFDRAAQAYGRGWLTLVDRHVKAELPDVRAVASAVAKGEADAAVVYATEATATENLRAVPIAGGLNVVASYSAATVRRSPSREAADRFVEFLFTPAAQTELAKRGFGSPLKAVAELPVLLGGESLRIFTNRMAVLPQANRVVGGVRHRGADLKAILSSARGTRVRFTGADGLSVDVALASIRKNGAILVRRPDGNLQVVLPGEPTSRWVRWLRRVEVL